MDLSVLILTYVMLGWGSTSWSAWLVCSTSAMSPSMPSAPMPMPLLATQHGLGFWAVLPLAGMFAATFGVLLGFPVLRLRGDYLAIVTLGFGEIIRLVILNWVDFTNRPGRHRLDSRPDPVRCGVRRDGHTDKNRPWPDARHSVRQQPAPDFSSITSSWCWR